MGRRRSRNKYTFHCIIVQYHVKRGRCFHMRKLPFYQLYLPLRRDADVFQRHAEIVKYWVKIGERVLAHADEGIRILVRLSEEALGAEAFVAVYQLLYHKFLR
mgnify:FL=1